MYSVDEMKTLLKKRLSKKRYNHSLNVADAAYKLAEQEGEDTHKAYIAGLLHDICKEDDQEQQLALALKGDMNLSGAELSSKALWHGPAGAYFIKKELGITDPDIMYAVRYHTIGRPGMTKLEEIVYLADLISDDREYKDVDRMRKLAYTDFPKAMYEAVRYSLMTAVKKENYVPEGTLELYNQYTFLCSSKKKNKEKNDGKK